MRTIVSTIGTVPYGTSKYLVEIIQVTLNKNKHCFINSNTFVQVSYGAVNLYPSVPVDKAINVLIDTINNNKEQPKKHTKLTTIDIHKVMALYLSKCYFLYENNLCLFQNCGPIGLSLMVVLSENYLLKIKCKGFMEALNYKIAPKILR